MVRELRFVNRSLLSGLWSIFRSSPFLALCSFSLILFISSVIPLAFVWILQLLILDTPIIRIQSPVLQTFFTIWSVAELIFLVYQLYLYSKIQLQTPAPDITPAERDQLVSYALANIKDLPSTLSKWFMGCPFEDIDRESIVGWLAFAFYSRHYDELSPDEYRQIDSFIDKIELDYQLKGTIQKSNKRRFYMKHLLDPVRVIFRPLIFYFVTDTLLNGIVASSLFYLRGYQFVQIGRLQLWTYFRPSDDRDEQEDEPIVFFHGIGSGLLFYQPFIGYLHQKFPRNRRIIFISMRCVCMRYPSLNDIPNMAETAESLELIFERFKMKKAIFIGHSYGTACLSWIVRTSPQYISRLIFIDPICFGLFEPYVIYNFVYRTPYKLGHLFMYYFVGRELGISYVVSRHFWWTQNNLYIEQIRSRSENKWPIFVLLAARDCIVNSRSVRDYLIDNEIDHYWAADLSHGGYMLDRDCWKKIGEWIS